MTSLFYALKNSLAVLILFIVPARVFFSRSMKARASLARCAAWTSSSCVASGSCFSKSRPMLSMSSSAMAILSLLSHSCKLVLLAFFGVILGFFSQIQNICLLVQIRVYLTPRFKQAAHDIDDFINLCFIVA